MPLYDFTGVPHYIRVHKIYVDSRERDETSEHVGRYRFTNFRPIQNVVGMEITGWMLPDAVTPTFMPPPAQVIPDVPGDDYVDFSLSAVGYDTRTFSFKWQPKGWLYNSAAVPHKDYIYFLRAYIMDAIRDDAIYGGNKVLVTASADAFEKTRLIVRGRAPFVGDGVTLTLLLASGPNKARSAWYQMGYAAPVDVASVTGLGDPLDPVQTLVSPARCIMEPRLFVDVFCDQYSKEDKLRRIYTGAKAKALGFSAEEAMWPDSRVRILSNMIEYLSALDITITMQDGADLQRVAEAGSDLEHLFIFTIYAVQEDVYVPEWCTRQMLLR